MKGQFTKPIGYIENVGRCAIKKVRDYGYKYLVYEGQCVWRFATLNKAREFAKKRP